MNSSGISFTSASAQLAAMLVESEADAAEQTNESLEAVQQRIAREADAEYDQRMAAAAASAQAAFIGGAFTIAGGAATIGAGVYRARALEQAPAPGMAPDAARDAQKAQMRSSMTSDFLGASGQTLSGLAPAASKYGGEIEAERRNARAQRTARSIEQASVEADQLAQQAQRQQRRSDSALDAARGFVEAEDARANAVLSNG
jgi:hypothetical protein